MSSSSSDALQEEVEVDVDEVVTDSERIPTWVHSFLGKTFFEKCIDHDYVQKCELNRYCITCDESICRFCITDGPHFDHKVLTIYRHVYQNVVPLTQMEKHIHCQRIQPYKCNKKWVVSLTPLPHNGSGLLIEGDGACYVCKRKLTDPERFRFCSIACKVQWKLGRRYCMVGSFAVEEKEEEAVPSDSFRKRRRKGVPFRAPN